MQFIYLIIFLLIYCIYFIYSILKLILPGYYGIEDPFPDLISKLRRFIGGIRSAGCWLSRAVGSQNAVMLMLRKLLLLEGS